MGGNDQLILTPGEIYYLGTVLQAKHIDYAYVMVMEDIQKQYAIFENETKEKLVEKHVLEEDFSGNMSVDPTFCALLNPLFFGEFESSVEIITRNQENTNHFAKRFHFYEGNITETIESADGFVIHKTDMSAIQGWIKDFFSQTLPDDHFKLPTAEIQQDKVAAVIVAKSNKLAVESKVNVMVEYDGHVLKEKSDGMAENLTYDELCKEIYECIKEA